MNTDNKPSEKTTCNKQELSILIGELMLEKFGDKETALAKIQAIVSSFERGNAVDNPDN